MCLSRYTSKFRERWIQGTMFVCMWMCTLIHILRHVDVCRNTHVHMHINSFRCVLEYALAWQAETYRWEQVIEGTIVVCTWMCTLIHMSTHVDVYLNTHITTCIAAHFDVNYHTRLHAEIYRWERVIKEAIVVCTCRRIFIHISTHIDVYLNTHITTWMACRNIQVGTGD